jgi:vacuolar-type H+-ATPase subunit C/Vma6
MRDRARLDPLGAAPILEVFMRLHIERTNLRCINWGITQGLSYNAIMAGTVAAP